MAKRTKISALILASALVFCNVPAFAQPVYGDVKESDWFYADVMKATELGLFEGAGGNFLPTKPLNRAEMSTVISRIAGGETTGKKGSELYSDVPAGAWYDEAIGRISELGVAEGNGDGTFSPLRQMKREQFAVMMYNLTVKNGLEGTNPGESQTFADSNEISSWARDAMDWAVSAGVLRGSGTKLFPQRVITRAEAAAALVRWTELKD